MKWPGLRACARDLGHKSEAKSERSSCIFSSTHSMAFLVCSFSLCLDVPGELKIWKKFMYIHAGSKKCERESQEGGKEREM